MNPQEIIRRFEAVKSQRSIVEDTWDWIERYISPYRGRFFKDERSENSIEWRRPWVYDATAIMAAQNLASSMHSRLTSQSTQWFGLRFREPALNEDTEALAWLEACAKEIFHALQESNFSLEISETYQDLVCFGTSVIFEEEIEIEGNKQINFKSIPIKQAYFEEDEKKQLLRFYRHIQWTAGEIVAKFGDEVPDCIKESINDAESVDKKYDVIFCIFPRDNKNLDASDAKVLSPEKRPFGFKYVLQNSGDMLGKEGGYYEMPAFVPRWRTTSSSMWGNSPAMIALGDTMTLNRTIEMNLKQVEKALDPPTLTTSRGLISDLDLEAGGLTVVRDINELSTFESKARFDVTYQEMERLRQNIESYFYIPQLLLPPMEGTPATATEIATRMQQLEGVISPTLGRLQKDLLDPIITRTFRILWRANLLPEVPQSVQDRGSNADIEYTSPMARTQDSSQVQAIERFLATVAGFAEIYPEARKLIETTDLFTELAILMGVSPKLLKPKGEVNREIKKDQQAMQAMQEGAAAKEMGEGLQALQQAGGEPQ